MGEVTVVAAICCVQGCFPRFFPERLTVGVEVEDALVAFINQQLNVPISTLAEQVTMIGARLLEERQKQGVELEAVAAKTYIPLRLLKAIGAGRIDLLPQPIFIQGLIRRYANAIGRDGTTVSKEFLVNQLPVTVALGPQRLIKAAPSCSKPTAFSKLDRPQPAASTVEAAPSSAAWVCVA